MPKAITTKTRFTALVQYYYMCANGHKERYAHYNTWAPSTNNTSR